jgi:hypothetical protein
MESRVHRLIHSVCVCVCLSFQTLERVSAPMRLGYNCRVLFQVNLVEAEKVRVAAADLRRGKLIIDSFRDMEHFLSTTKNAQLFILLVYGGR